MAKISRNLHQHLKTILLDCFVWFFNTAFLAAVNNSIFLAGFFHSYRIHHPTAFLRAIAGKNIHMFAPQTLRAVVGVAAPSHTRVAHLANEILLVFYKFLRRHFCRDAGNRIRISRTRIVNTTVILHPVFIFQNPVGVPGIEPGPLVPKTSILPIYYTPIDKNQSNTKAENHKQKITKPNLPLNLLWKFSL